jgi:hypothetical protein
MRIKVTSLAIFHQKRGMGYEKRERKRKVAMPSQKEARGRKLLKGVSLPPNIPHTCTS